MKSFLTYLPNRENAPSLFDGNGREDLIRRRDDAAKILTEEKASTKQSLAKRREARVALANVYSDADDAGLWIGQETETAKTGKDRALIQAIQTTLRGRSMKAARA